MKIFMEVLCANEGKAHKINAIKIPKQLFYDALDGITGNSNNDLRCNFHTEGILILHAYDLAVDATGKHNAGTDLHVRMDFAKLLALIAHILGRDSIQDETDNAHNDCQRNASPNNYFLIDHCLDSVAFIRFGFFGRSL